MTNDIKSLLHRLVQKYNFEQMICTDIDQLQFARELSESVWEYCQVTNLRILDMFGGDADSFVKAYMGNEVVDGITVWEMMDNGYSVVSETIDLLKYTAEEIDEGLRPFGYTFCEEGGADSVKEIYPDSWKQICCECIFENDVQDSIAENVLEQDSVYYN